MATGVTSWSQTAATNATADANVNAAEGMAPSAVNDAMRAMMASVAKYRDDNNGSLTTAGGTTNYTVSTNQGFATLAAMHRQSLRILWGTTCAASPTLNADGLGAKNIVTTVGTNVGASGLLANAVYDFIYENNNAVWIVATAPLTFVSGTVMLFMQTAAPTGWTKSTTHNDKALRIVSGTASSGGSTAFTSVFASRTITQGNLPSYTLTGGSVNFASMTATPGPGTVNGGHSLANAITTVSGGSATNNFLRSANGDAMTVTLGGTASCTVPSGGSGTGFDFAVQYADVVAATKD